MKIVERNRDLEYTKNYEIIWKVLKVFLSKSQRSTWFFTSGINKRLRNINDFLMQAVIANRKSVKLPSSLYEATEILILKLDIIKEENMGPPHLGITWGKKATTTKTTIKKRAK